MSARVAPEPMPWTTGTGSPTPTEHRKGEKKIQPSGRRIACEVLVVTTLAVMTAATIALSVAIYYVVIFTKPEQTAKTDLCQTDECVRTAGRILSTMDPLLDPCDNFFRFTCNRWIQDNILFGSVDSIMSDLSSQTYGRTKELVQQKLLQNQTEHVQKSLKLYTSCMNKTVIETIGPGALLNDIADAVGWPSLNTTWKPRTDTISQAIVKLFNKGLIYKQLFRIGSYRNLNDSTNYILTIGEGSLAVDNKEDLLEHPKTVSIYKSLMTEMAMIYGATNQTYASQQISDAVDFELWVANNSMDFKDSNNVTITNNYLTLHNLSTICPQIDWVMFVNEITPSDVNITEDLVVRVLNVEYLRQLSDKLANTDDRVVRNYLSYRAALSGSLQLGWKMRNIFQRFRTRVLKKRALDEYVYCLDVNTYLLTYSLTNMYIKKYFSNSAKDQVTEMVQRIQTVFHNSIINLGWMGPNTRKNALEKLRNMLIFVGYSEPIVNDTVVNDYYKEVNIFPNLYYRNVRNLLRFKRKNHFASLFNPRPKTDWKEHGTSFVTNAYYTFSENSIEILAGIIDGIFFDDDRPKFSTFGTLGIVIGHEFTHGFDDKGSKFDAHGNFRNWWDKETGKEFSERTTCMKDQYSNYTIQGINLNGELTLGENIADNGGVKQAYWAYQNWKKAHGDEKQLPGLEYNTDQLFWLSYGSSRCAEYSKKHIDKANKYYVHSLQEARVNVPLQNFPQFSKDFNCSLDSKMNPQHKCNVW